jgi:hypothetical protein
LVRESEHIMPASVLPDLPVDLGRLGLGQRTTPITITVAKACEISGFGATTLWQLIRDSRVETVRVAGIKRTLIVYSSLVRLLTPAHPSQPAPRKPRARLVGTLSPKLAKSSEPKLLP